MAETNHTFFKFMNDLIDSGVWAKLSSTARSLYPVLCRFSDETFKCVWPGGEKLLQLTGLKTKRSLQLAKKELVEIGLLDIIPGSGRTPTRYHFRFAYPNSKIDLDTYRDTTVSRREIKQYPPPGYSSTPHPDTLLPPNQIHINIHQNNDKQESLLEGMQTLLQQFLEKLPQNTAENYKQHIISQMLSKYGQLEVGEAIRIAIQKGKDGDIRYLEGILKNRKNEPPVSASHRRTSPMFSQGEQIKSQIKSNLPEDWHIWVDELELRYAHNGVTYFSHRDSAIAEILQNEAQQKGISLRIFSPSA